jgi:hypothetical protein
MNLDAPSLTVWQTCRRRYLLDAQYRVLRWRPKQLFDALLRRAIFALSNGEDAAQLASDAKSQFLSTAANPGLDLPSGTNPYLIAKSWCGMFDTVLRVLAKTPLLTVRELPPVTLNSWLTWTPRAWADDSGQLHRWLTIDAWDEDALSREMHSWRTVGDIAATRSPMQLHVIEIGRATDKGRSTPWVRAWQHPGLRSLHYQFRKPTGGELSSGWLAYHYNDTRDDPDEWAAQMIKEGEAERSMHHLAVNAPDETRCAEVMREVMMEGLEIRELVEEDRLWHTVPMARGACDSFVPCPFQYACYAETVIAPESLGLFQRRESSTVTVKEGS